MLSSDTPQNSSYLKNWSIILRFVNEVEETITIANEEEETATFVNEEEKTEKT